MQIESILAQLYYNFAGVIDNFVNAKAAPLDFSWLEWVCCWACQNVTQYAKVMVNTT